MAYTWECLDVLRWTGRQHPLLAPDHLKYKQPSITKGRLDIVAVTPWLAPIVWEGTFDPRLMDSIYKPQNLTIFATVFAVGKYVRFLRDFLLTAEQHFFVGYRVDYYVFTDPYMWINKPTKVLSSRYMWQDFKLRKPELGIIRFSGVKKNYSEIRPNV
ncbi:globoside alpha-1,3-N-acetylgalactosaminyltransferase 1-like [Gadus morhua]|uniref:globoside alpha-1,3-N-acetylgalactosaminyltransferase 1-like n=1 Tax=Gadus morhua TaxID=8049 RepID=UPI0011B42652|nr:globoside alpha-1,3-N-acetylgalactosaminyltransferase 1-like [Gadus morhua]